MNTILIISSNEKDKTLLSQIFRNLGADAMFSQNLNDALALLEKFRPKTLFVVDEEEPPTNIKIRELLKIAPFIPVIILLKERDSSKAIEYMKLGAFDCGQPPWTEEEIRPLYKKSLNITGTTFDLQKPQFGIKKIVQYFGLFIILLLIGFFFGWYYMFNKYAQQKRTLDRTVLPYSHPSGIAFDKKGILITDWYTQSVYRHDLDDFKITKVLNFPDITPIAMAFGENTLWIADASGYIEKRMKNDKLTLLSRQKLKERNLAGICFDGLYFWIANAKENIISQHLNNDELTEVKSYFYPGQTISAATCDSRFLWVADENLKSLVKLSLENPEKIISKKEIKEFSSKTLKITAMASLNNKIWFVAEDKNNGILFSENY